MGQNLQGGRKTDIHVQSLTLVTPGLPFIFRMLIKINNSGLNDRQYSLSLLPSPGY